MEETTAVEITEFTSYIFEGNIEKLTKDITKMNKKAVKLGCDPIVLSLTGNTSYRAISGEPNDPNKVLFVEVKLVGKSPKLPDWSLVACCDHDPIMGQTFRTVPNKSVPAQYLPNSTYCDHCKSDRRRNSTYILENVKTGENVRVGSTCLKDFLGHKEAEMFLFYAGFVSMLEDVETEYGYTDGCRSTYYFDLDVVLAMTIRIMSKFGYVSNTKAQDSEGTLMSTSSEIFWQFAPKNPDKIVPTEEELAQAQVMIDWAKQQDPNSNSYMYNLVAIANAGMVKHSLMGFAVSIAPAYNRAMDLIRERERKVPSEYYGTVGDKVALELMYTRSFGYESQFGYVFIHKFESKDGNTFSWKTSIELAANEKQWFTVRGTIKAHEEYKGYKSTVLTRCKMVELV